MTRAETGNYFFSLYLYYVLYLKIIGINMSVHNVVCFLPWWNRHISYFVETHQLSFDYEYLSKYVGLFCKECMRCAD